MRILHAYNIHRGIGGSDSAREATIAALRGAGVDVDEFVRDSRQISMGLGGKMQAFFGGLYSAGAVREFTTCIERVRPDALHVHELYPLISPWILPKAVAAGIPVFMSVYDYRLTCPVATHIARGKECLRCIGGREHWCVLRNCRSHLAESMAYALRNASANRFGLYLRHVHRFMTISRHQSDHLVARAGVDSSRILLNPCAVPVASKPVDDPYSGGYVAYAGRFVPEKGVEVMIEACRRIGLPMAFAGDAPSHPAVRPEDDARFVMTRSAAELAEFYRGARMVVVPSTWPETFGMVAAEAMSHGVPVVASRIGALPDTVLDGSTGLLAEPGNVSDLADKIERIWNDPALARRLGRGAYGHVRSQFSEQIHAARLISAYHEAIEDAPGRP